MSIWTPYRISSNVSRKIGIIRDNFEHYLVPVITADITTAIIAAVGTQPILVFPSRDNDAQPESPTTSWIVCFKNDHAPLPRILFLFILRTTSCMLPCRSAVTQCTRCLLWHNSRVCSSHTRCRLYCSSHHTENNIKNLCASSVDHLCSLIPSSITVLTLCITRSANYALILPRA